MERSWVESHQPLYEDPEMGAFVTKADAPLRGNVSGSFVTFVHIQVPVEGLPGTGGSISPGSRPDCA